MSLECYQNAMGQEDKQKGGFGHMKGNELLPSGNAIGSTWHCICIMICSWLFSSGYPT